jgi:serine/threonine protein phosphatase PrpC
VAVADGVSATPLAALAAQVAVEAAVAVPIADDSLSAVCDAALRTATAAVAAAVGEVARGATTLVVAAVGADGRWAAARVGDSDAFLLGASGWQAVFAGDGDDEVRSGATDALPAPRARAVHHEGTFAPGQVLVLLSDGVGGPLRDGPSTVALGVAQALAVPPSPLDLARLVDFARQGCHDDRTLLAVWPAPGSGDTPTP